MFQSQAQAVIRAVGIGEAGDAALKRAARGGEWGAEILPTDKSTQKNLTGADLLLLAIDASNKENVDSACAVIETAKAEKILVFSVALSPSEDQKGGEEALVRLEAKTDALFVVSQVSETSERDVFADILCALRQCLKLALEAEADICVDLADLKKLFTDAGKVFLGVGLGKGNERVELAAREALGKPVTESPSAGNLRKALLCVETDGSATLSEIQKAAQVMADASAEDAELLWCHAANPDMKDSAKVVVLAAW